MKNIYIKPSDDISHILNNLDEEATIYLAEGVYRAKIWIKADGVKLVGAGRETTKITFDDYARKPHADGGEYNTFRTYTLCVTGKNCFVENLTIENSNAHPEKVGQCVALSVNSPSFIARNVDLVSTQDTLFTSPFPDDLVVRYSGLTDDPAYYDGFIPREQLYMQGGAVQIFENCRIYGSVDFIFGCAEAYFDNCKLISVGDARNTGYVAAPAHSLKQDRGYVFLNCSFESQGAKDGSIYLARPWRDFGKCDFIDCSLGKHISPLLFDKWNDTFRDKTCRFAYSGLKTSLPLSPVPWSREISEEEKCRITARFNQLKNSMNF